MLQQEHYIKEITDKLAWINSKVDLSSSLNLYDIAIHSETFFCDLLNIIFGYNLHNVNFSSKNYPAIDLADEKAALAVQVTCENKRQKIQDTLTKFATHNYCKQYSRLIILIIGKNKPNFRDNFKISPNILSFSKETDILDIKDLLHSIAALPFKKIRKVHTFLQEQLSPNNGFSGTNNTAIVQTVNAIQQQAYALCVSKLNAIGVSTEIALNLISQDMESNKYNYILDAASQGKQFLIGEFGSGKSHAIYVLIQSMAEQYLSGKIDKIPLFARSKDILAAGSIQNWIKI